jgi:hypothetical protein
MRKKTILLIILGSLIIISCAVVLIMEFANRSLSHFVDEVIYNDYNHYLPCDKLPTSEEVNTVMLAHADVITRIEALSPGNVVVALEEYGEICPTKADIRIYYPSRQVREQIEDILGGKTFFNIPCRFHNW